MRNLPRNNIDFYWSWEQKQAFNNIKKLSSSVPVLKG